MVCIFCTSNCKDISQQVNVMSVNGTFGCHFEFFPPSCSFHKMGTALDIFLVRNGNNWHQIRNSRWPGSVDINIIRIHNIVMTSSFCDVITLLSCKSMKPIIYSMKAGIILVSMVYDTLTHLRWYQSLYFFGPKWTTNSIVWFLGCIQLIQRILQTLQSVKQLMRSWSNKRYIHYFKSTQEYNT